MFCSVVNQDCNEIISSFIDLSSLLAMMQCNKKLNDESMVVFGKRYHKKIPKSGLKTVIKTFSPKQQEVLRRLPCRLLPGNFECLVENKCRICGVGTIWGVMSNEKSSIIEEYGLVAHESCIRSREKLLIVAGITGYIRPHLCDLRSRKRNGCFHTVAIEKQIPGIFPIEYTIKGQDLDEAHEDAARALCDKHGLEPLSSTRELYSLIKLNIFKK